MLQWLSYRCVTLCCSGCCDVVGGAERRRFREFPNPQFDHNDSAAMMAAVTMTTCVLRGERRRVTVETRVSVHSVCCSD